MSATFSSIQDFANEENSFFLESNQWHLLENKLLWVAEGEIDLFLYNQQEGFEHRIFLTAIQPQQLIFPIGKILLHSSHTAKIYELKAAQINDFEFLAKHLGPWLNALSKAAEIHPPKELHHYLEMDQQLSLNEQEVVIMPKSVDDIPWLAISQGKLSLLGNSDAIFSQNEVLYPAVYPFWFQALEGDTQIKLIKPNKENAKLCWKGLEFFNQMFIRILLSKNLSKIKEEEKEQFTREQRDQELIYMTMARMGNIFTSSKFVDKALGKDPLLNTCQIIGNKIQKDFREPLISRAQTLQDRIYEIAIASNVYMREVTLKKGWWHQNSGNLLGLYEKNHNLQPVALLQEKSNKYSEINVIEGSSTIINKKKAKAIKEKAWFFYRSFPPKAIITIKDILRFCSFNRIKDYSLVLGTAFLAVLLGLFFPFANKIVFDDVIPYLDQTLLEHVIIGLLVAALSILVVSFTREYAVLRIEGQLDHDIETSIWERLLQLPVQFFRKYTVGNLLQRLSLVKEVRKVLSSQMIRVVINALFSILYLAIMVYFSLILSIVGLSIVLIGLILTVVIGRQAP